MSYALVKIYSTVQYNIVQYSIQYRFREKTGRPVLTALAS